MTRQRPETEPWPNSAAPELVSAAVAAFGQKPDYTLSRLHPVSEDGGHICSGLRNQQPEAFWDWIHEEDRERMGIRLGTWPDSEDWHRAMFRIRHCQTGQVRHLLELRRRLPRVEKQTGEWEGFWVDRTDAQRAVRRLSAAACQETLSRFAVGYAHDLNNTLTGIGSIAELCFLEAKGNPQMEHNLAMLKENATRASLLINALGRLLFQGRRGKLHRDLNDLGREVLEWIRPAVPRRIALEGQWTDSPVPVFLAEEECRHVLFGLIFNAAAAISGPGRIRLEASVQDHFRPGEVTAGRAPEGPAACLAVRDSGRGVALQGRDRLFDLTYSTRADGWGIGHGLARARQFVLAHEGAVTMESRAGEGSVFSLWLPLSDFEELGEPGESRDLKLLVAGPCGPVVERLVSGLAGNGWSVVRALREPEQALASGEETYAAAIVDWELQGDEAGDFLHFMGRKEVPVKLILVAHQSSERARKPFLAESDLVLDPEEPLAMMQKRIRSLLDPDEPG